MAHHLKKYFKCHRKRRYSKKKAADNILKKMQKTKPFNLGLNTYKCEFCEGWHIGKKIKGDQA